MREGWILAELVGQNPRPGGPTDNSPALQRREKVEWKDSSPGGTTEFSRPHFSPWGLWQSPASVVYEMASREFTT